MTELVTTLNGRTYREPVHTTYTPNAKEPCTVPAHLILAENGRTFTPQGRGYVGRHNVQK